MLHETASRADAVLQLNVEDCDFGNRRARVTVKGGDTAWIVWGRGIALLLPPRYLRGRTAGPLFCADRALNWDDRVDERTQHVHDRVVVIRAVH
jgi:hypothetical protein